jgi:hypothetical protein
MKQNKREINFASWHGLDKKKHAILIQLVAGGL